MFTNFQLKRLKLNLDIVEKPENRVHKLTDSNVSPKLGLWLGLYAHLTARTTVSKERSPLYILTLSRTDKDGIQADYLDLDISISTNGFFNCNLFDKRDDFKFKVINYPCLNFSNIPVQPAYGIYLSQLLRICRICSDINNFYIAISKITKEFLLKGFNKCILFKYFVKFVCQYELNGANLVFYLSLPLFSKLNEVFVIYF